MTETVFSKIIRREIPAEIVFEDDDCLAFHDRAPRAPVHILVIPKKPIPSVAAIEPEDQPLIGHLFSVIRQIAEQQNLEKGYRVITNCGEEGGQEVEHLHFHLLGGRKLLWSPA